MMVTKMSTVEGLAKARDGRMVGGEGKGAGRLRGRDGGEGGLLPLHDWQLGDSNSAAAFGEMLVRGGRTTEDGPSPPLSITSHTALALGGPSGPPPGAPPTQPVTPAARQGTAIVHEPGEGGGTGHHEEEGRSEGRQRRGAS